MHKRLSKAVIVLCVGLLLLLTACGDPTRPPYPTLVPEQLTANAGSAATIAAGVPTVGNPRPSVAVTRATPGVAGASLTAKLKEKDVVRTWQDSAGRTIKLVYGRGEGHSGDYGWAHIYGKHVQGIWFDGGTITTFSQAVNAKTPEAVVDLIGKSLSDKQPDSSGGRRTYSYPVPGTNRDVFTVVGDDGTIITSYPVPHGSKDNDN